MSFRCAECNQVKTQGRQVVRETREKTYYEKRYERGHEVMVPVGAGHETVREERLCSECYQEAVTELENELGAIAQGG